MSYSPCNAHPHPDEVYGIEIWSTIEPGLGISAAPTATLRPLLRIFAAKVGLGTNSSPPASAGLQMSSSERASPTYGNPNTTFGNLRGHIRSLPLGGETQLGGGMPASRSVTKLVLEESHSMASAAESIPRTRQRTVVLEHGWPEPEN